jgi:isoprenylcysteine carboxyl methyltransferase (ICMT) family protein YpbQ
MPFWKPGSLSEEDAWGVTAYLLRQNRLWSDNAELGESNSANVMIPRAAFLTPVGVTPQAESQKSNSDSRMLGILLISLPILLLLAMFILKKYRNTTTI